MCFSFFSPYTARKPNWLPIATAVCVCVERTESIQAKLSCTKQPCSMKRKTASPHSCKVSKVYCWLVKQRYKILMDGPVSLPIHMNPTVVGCGVGHGMALAALASNWRLAYCWYVHACSEQGKPKWMHLPVRCHVECKQQEVDLPHFCFPYVCLFIECVCRNFFFPKSLTAWAYLASWLEGGGAMWWSCVNVLHRIYRALLLR